MRLPRLLVILGSVLIGAACGKVGDPLPPFIRIPEAVKDLSATQAGYNIVLTWTNPPHNIDGSAATNLAHVQIRLNDAPIATLMATAAGQPQSYTIPAGPLVSGERTFTLVVDTNRGKVSNISNKAAITPVQVPGPVGRLRAIADQRRIILQWEKPQEHPELAEAYVVSRTDLPAESETIMDTRYEDTRYQPGKSFTYAVTPARHVSDKWIAGIPSEPLTITAEDKTAPEVPSGIEIVEADTGAYVTWNPNGEADLAGYRVFRSERADGGFKPVTDHLITNNGYFDQMYRPGLYYFVSAVDEFENESQPSPPVRVP